MFIIFLLLCLCVLPTFGAVITYVISKIKGVEHIKRNVVIAFLFVFNSQIIYFFSAEAVESWFGIHDRSFIFNTDFDVSTPYGKFTSSDSDYETYANDKCSYRIDSIAAYDQYVVLSADSSYLFVDQQANVTEVSSLAELPVEVQQKDFVRASYYIGDLYRQIHDGNYLYVIKTLIALVLSALVTAVEYFLFKKIWSGVRKSVS